MFYSGNDLLSVIVKENVIVFNSLLTHVDTQL